MYTPEQLNEYMAEIRDQVCRGCIDRPPGGPPCAPRGKQCGIELHLTEIVELAHRTHSHAIDPYIEKFHSDVCTTVRTVIRVTAPARSTRSCCSPSRQLKPSMSAMRLKNVLTRMRPMTGNHLSHKHG